LNKLKFTNKIHFEGKMNSTKISSTAIAPVLISNLERRVMGRVQQQSRWCGLDFG
jgi:hypothetical protein